MVVMYISHPGLQHRLDGAYLAGHDVVHVVLVPVVYESHACRSHYDQCQAQRDGKDGIDSRPVVVPAECGLPVPAPVREQVQHAERYQQQV